MKISAIIYNKVLEDQDLLVLTTMKKFKLFTLIKIQWSNINNENENIF